MKPIPLGTRVTLPEHEFLSDGKIIAIHKSPFQKEVFGYTVKLDKPAPNEYAYNTDEVFMFPNDIEVV